MKTVLSLALCLLCSTVYAGHFQRVVVQRQVVPIEKVAVQKIVQQQIVQKVVQQQVVHHNVQNIVVQRNIVNIPSRVVPKIQSFRVVEVPNLQSRVAITSFGTPVVVQQPVVVNSGVGGILNGVANIISASKGNRIFIGGF